jgi:hypothetical protein
MVLAIGKRLPLHLLGRGGSIAFLALALTLVVLIRYWPRLVEQIERWWRSR